jgi:hypothetical protein
VEKTETKHLWGEKASRMKWKFESRDIWVVLSGIIFLVCLAGAILLESGPKRWFAVMGALSTGISAIFLVAYRPPLTPFEKVYFHDDWHFAANDHDFPRLYIPATTHRMGRELHVEFRQGDQVFRIRIDGEGNVVIIRNNYGFGHYPPLGVIIREHV